MIVLKWREFNIIVMCYKLRAKLWFYGFLSFLGTFALKVVQTWFVLHETLYIIVLKWSEFKILVICYKLRAKTWLYGFLSFFGTFARKVALTWFVLHKTWHTTLFGICYCDKVVLIENHSHMRENYVISYDFMGF